MRLCRSLEKIFFFYLWNLTSSLKYRHTHPATASSTAQDHEPSKSWSVFSVPAHWNTHVFPAHAGRLVRQLDCWQALWQIVTRPHGEVLLYGFFVADYSDCSLYRCFANFTILKSQHNYSSSQPGMGITQSMLPPFLPVSVHHICVSF